MSRDNRIRTNTPPGRKRLKALLDIIVLCSLLLGACGGGGSGGGGSAPPPSTGDGTIESPTLLAVRTPFESHVPAKGKSYYTFTAAHSVNHAVTLSLTDSDLSWSLYTDSSFSTLTLTCNTTALAADETCWTSTPLTPGNTYYIMVEEIGGSSNLLTVEVLRLNHMEGTLAAPYILSLSTGLPHSGEVDRTTSYYNITGLTMGRNYMASLTGLTDDADLYVYDSDPSFTTPAICSPDNTINLGLIAEDCTLISTSTNIYIEVDGKYTSEGAKYDLNLVDLTIPKPDLQITIDSVTANGTNITFNYTITNKGTEATDGATFFDIDFFTDPALPPSVGDMGDSFVSLAPAIIAAGDTHSGSHSFTSTATSGYAYAVVDSFNALNEGNETNNVSPAFSWDSGLGGTTYWIETFPNGAATTTDTWLYVYHSSDTVNPIQDNDDGGLGGFGYSGLQADLVSGDTYYIKVAGFNASFSGAYSLHMSDTAFGGSSAFDPGDPDGNEPDDEPAQAKSISVNTVYDRTLTTGGGDVDWFSFIAP